MNHPFEPGEPSGWWNPCTHVITVDGIPRSCGTSHRPIPLDEILAHIQATVAHLMARIPLGDRSELAYIDLRVVEAQIRAIREAWKKPGDLDSPACVCCDWPEFRP